MELVTENSEEGLIDLLAAIESNPEKWVSIHVNLARISEEMLDRESLCKETLTKMGKKSLDVAFLLFNSRLNSFEGTVFMFEDHDVLALFVKDSPGTWQTIVENLRKEFTAAGLDSILSIYEMKEKLSNLLAFSEQKKESAEMYRWKQRAVEVAESVFSWSGAERFLTQEIQRRRAERTEPRVLIVEDDVVARGVIALGFREASCKVIQANDAKSAIINFMDSAPDMVLLDIHLPDHSGHKVLNRIKLLDPDAYVIMLSGDSVARNVISSRSEGAAGFVKKPFSKDKILEYYKQCPTCHRADDKIASNA